MIIKYIIIITRGLQIFFTTYLRLCNEFRLVVRGHLAFVDNYNVKII